MIIVDDDLFAPRLDGPDQGCIDGCASLPRPGVQDLDDVQGEDVQDVQEDCWQCSRYS